MENTMLHFQCCFQFLNERLKHFNMLKPTLSLTYRENEKSLFTRFNFVDECCIGRNFRLAGVLV